MDWHHVTTWIAGIAPPLGYLAQPAKRVFFLNLVAAVVLALGWPSGRRGLRYRWRQLVGGETWWTRSSWLDVQLLFINGWIAQALSLSRLAPTAFVAAATSTLLVGLFGQHHVGSPSLPMRIVVDGSYTLALFVAGDASRFALHRLMHSHPRLWRLHRVHHSAPTLTPLTVYRVHPLESLLYGIRGILSAGLVTGTFFYLVGDQLRGYDVLGVNGLGFVFNLLGSNLRHSHVWLSYGAGLERFLISPAQHQLHHAATFGNRAVNYGTCLAIWDRYGQSWCGAHDACPPATGLADATREEQWSLRAALGAPRALKDSGGPRS